MGEQDEIGNKEGLGPQWFGYQGNYAEELALRTTVYPCPVYEGTRIHEYARLFCHHTINPLKAEATGPLHVPTVNQPHK